MSIEENKVLIRRWLDEVINKRDPAALDAFSVRDFAGHFAGLREPVRGVEAWKQIWSSYCTAFPDFHLTLEDEIAEGDKVVIRYTWQATQRGEFHGTQPTGKPVAGRGMCIFRIVGGRIAEEWNQDEQMYEA